MPEKEKTPANLGDQVMCLPSIGKYLGEEDILRSLKELMTTISPLELEAVTEMIENFLSLSLEITAGKGAEPHLIPVTFKNLYSEMVELEANNFEGIRNPETLQGKQVILRLTDPESQESRNINAAMTWTRSQVDNKINVILKILNARSDKQANKNFENLSPNASKDTQRFWNLWDDSQLNRENIDKRDNFLLLCLACGTIGSSFLDPRSFQIMQYLISVIGLGNVIKFLQER